MERIQLPTITTRITTILLHTTITTTIIILSRHIPTTTLEAAAAVVAPRAVVLRVEAPAPAAAVAALKAAAVAPRAVVLRVEAQRALRDGNINTKAAHTTRSFRLTRCKWFCMALWDS